MAHRSAITGRYITKAAAARHPSTSVREASAGNRDTGTHHRSAASGRFVTAATAARNPKTTLTENRRPRA
ncbi:hypothetical protein GS489_00715 [Rhodococcus hoagii]|nr:hypothetical protein [Prescottella equi]